MDVLRQDVLYFSGGKAKWGKGPPPQNLAGAPGSPHRPGSQNLPKMRERNPRMNDRSFDFEKTLNAVQISVDMAIQGE